jgi:hypothetical protein
MESGKNIIKKSIYLGKRWKNLTRFDSLVSKLYNKSNNDNRNSFVLSSEAHEVNKTESHCKRK